MKESFYMVLKPIRNILTHQSSVFNNICLLVCQICFGLFVCLHRPENHLLPVMNLFDFVQTHFLASFCVSYWYFKSYWYEPSVLSFGDHGSIYPSYQLENPSLRLKISISLPNPTTASWVYLCSDTGQT